jgi:hypothetical protein
VKLKLNLPEMHGLREALATLDGFERVVRDGDRDRVVTQYYALGAARLDIARNMNKLKAALEAIDQARVALVRECKGGPGDLRQGDPGWPRFVAEFEAMANREEEIEFIPVKRDDLKLDQNEIPVTTLAALEAIIV